MADWIGLVPPLLAALYAGWCGNLFGGVTAAGSTVALAALLAMTALSALSGASERGAFLPPWTGHWSDPLRLGRAWRLAPLGLWIAVAASAWGSPVARAGLQAVVLLPAYCLLPAAIARCWATTAARRLGARGMAIAVGGMAAWALAGEREASLDAPGGLRAVAMGSPVAHGTPGLRAMLVPLGHHTLLAVWLAMLLPLAVLPLREKTHWRWLGAAAAMLGVAAVLAGRSLAGGAALICEALLAAIWLLRAAESRRTRRWLAAGLVLLGLTLAVAQAARIQRIAGWRDPSARARLVYLRAGVAGWHERPWLGWGPGAAPWTAAWFLAPRPGLNPWGEAVGELHSLPVHLAYETGVAGLLAALATAGVFGWRRWGERRVAGDPGLLGAGCLGLAGATIAWLGTAALAVPALPWALAAAGGAALAGGAPAVRQRPSGEVASPPPVAGGRTAKVSMLSPAVCIYVLVAAAALLAPEAARWHYDRAVGAGEAGRRSAAVAELAAAVRLDPGFPLYRMRLAILGETTPKGRAAAASLALQAAREARGVGLLWLVAGILGRATGEVWAAAALEQSCALDPLAPYPPFYLMAATPDSAAAPRLGARALLAEPRLLAAIFWEGREPLFRRALEEVRRWPGVDTGWKLALEQAAPPAAARRGPVRSLGLAIDTAAFAQSTSLHLFRRVPWPALWPLVEVREALLPAARLPPALSLPGRNGTRLEKNAY